MQTLNEQSHIRQLVVRPNFTVRCIFFPFLFFLFLMCDILYVSLLSKFYMCRYICIYKYVYMHIYMENYITDFQTVKYMLYFQRHFINFSISVEA